MKILALTADKCAIILASLEDPPDGLAQLRPVLLNEHEWRQREGLDPVGPCGSERRRQRDLTTWGCLYPPHAAEI